MSLQRHTWAARRAVGPFALLLACGLALTSCYKLETAIAIEDDGSGTMAYVLALDTDAILSFGALADDPTAAVDRDELCEDFEAESTNDGDVPLGVEVEPYEDGSYCGVRVSAEIGASDDPGAVFSELLSDEAGESGELILRRNELGGWDFSYAGIAAMIEDNDASLPLEDGDGEGEMEAFADIFMQAIVISYEVSLPGSPVEDRSDATAISADGGSSTFSWDVDIANIPDMITASTMAPVAETAVTPTTIVEQGDIKQGDIEQGDIADASGPVETTVTSAADSQPEDLAFAEEQAGNTGLLLGLGALMLVLAGGGWLMINRADSQAGDHS